LAVALKISHIVEEIMKYILIILLIIVFISPVFSAELVTVKTLNGRVEVKEPGGTWSKAFEGKEIPAGTLISTGFKSQAELDLSGSSTIFIKQLTRISVDELKISGKQVNTKLNLRLGRIKANVKTSQGLKHDFTLRTPVSTAAVRGTVFESSVRKLEVVTGRMKLTNKIGQSTTVGGGSSSSVSGTGYTAPATVIETIIGDFTVETSTQPDAEVPAIVVPSAPTTGTIYVTWDLLDPPPS
jgi:FecR protein